LSLSGLLNPSFQALGVNSMTPFFDVIIPCTADKARYINIFVAMTIYMPLGL
jgi:hypothetical protein